jgi:GntR family transcriptional repressor for pyruvate dehydrogenase complex
MAMPEKQMEADLEFTRVPRLSLSDHIVEQIAEMIARGSLKPGDRMPSEKQLCEKFGVGRTSVREALRSLSVMGVLQSHMGDGTFVATDASRFLQRSFHWGLLLNAKVVEDLIETRLMLESHNAQLAALKAAGDDLVRMEQSVRLMEEHVGDPAQYLDADLQFHLTIAQATQNSILQSLLSTTRGYLQAWIRETLARAENSEKRARLSITEHKRILRALRNKDSEAARQAMAAHILSSSADLKHRQAQRSHG